MRLLVCSSLKILFQIYRYILSPMIHLIFGAGMGCRFHPTCSQYAEESISRWGIGRGGYFALKRLFRCNPWGGFGADPVLIRPTDHLVKKIEKRSP